MKGTQWSNSDRRITGSNYGVYHYVFRSILERPNTIYPGPCVDFFAPGYAITSCFPYKKKKDKMKKDPDVRTFFFGMKA
jgi:hypothetical protein